MYVLCVEKCAREIRWKDLVCERKAGRKQVSRESEGRWIRIPRGSVRECLRCELDASDEGGIVPRMIIGNGS